MTQLKGRTAIVTGGSSGIGAGIATAFARAGAQVMIAARRTEALEQVADAIAAEGGTAFAHTTDVTREDEVEALFAAADAKFGRLDLLVNAAGIADHTPTQDLALERWQAIVDINITAAFLCSRAAFRRMIPQKNGRIINIGSISAKMPRPHALGYTATKFALDGMTRSLALDGREHGITVSILHPGSTVSELSPNMAARPKSACMATEDIAAIATLMAALPPETNLLEALALPIDQPFLGRG